MKDGRRRQKTIWIWFNRIRRCNVSKCVTISSGLCLCLAILITILVTSNPYPAHASCLITWKFTNSCRPIYNSVKDQIIKWQGPENCKLGGEKCLYKLVSQTNTSLTASHTTPVKQYIDDLQFTFSSSADNNKVCTVKAFSTSQTWYAYLDYGTNYCNLHNLISGSGLDHTPGYSEMTKDAQCTQYSTADCNVY